jgi:hypothetical protein
LWGAEVGRVQYSRDNGIVIAERQVLFDLTTDGAALELVHTWDVLENERSRASLVENLNEFAVKAIARILKQPIVVMDLAVRLAGRPTCEEVKPADATDSVEHGGVVSLRRQVTLDHDGFRKS